MIKALSHIARRIYLFYSACLGIGYGMLLENKAIIQINTVAAVVVGGYLVSFVYVSQPKVGLITAFNA